MLRQQKCCVYYGCFSCVPKKVMYGREVQKYVEVLETKMEKDEGDRL